jgi:hypothetical protein
MTLRWPQVDVVEAGVPNGSISATHFQTQLERMQARRLRPIA